MGLLWYLPNREKVATLPPVHQALARLGLIVGVGQTLALIALAVLYSLHQAAAS